MGEDKGPVRKDFWMMDLFYFASSSAYTIPCSWQIHHAKHLKVSKFYCMLLMSQLTKHLLGEDEISSCYLANSIIPLIAFLHIFIFMWGLNFELYLLISEGYPFPLFSQTIRVPEFLYQTCFRTGSVVKSGIKVTSLKLYLYIKHTLSFVSF